jgi:cbb3-type cytochrome oxidase subunit 3
METFVHFAPTIATVFFFLAFCYVIYVAFKKDNQKKFKQFSKIPLNDHD